MRSSFSRVASGVVTVTLAACGGSTVSKLDAQDGGPQEGEVHAVHEYKEDACTKPLLTDLAPASPVDAIDMRRPPNQRQGEVNATTIASTGSPCATATNVAACKEAFSKASASAAWTTTYGEGGLSYGTAYLVTSKGDVVDVISEPVALAALLGPIDSLAKAQLVAQLYGYPDACKMNAIADGYEAFEEESFCSIGKNQYRIIIHRDATVTVADYEQIEKPTCIEGRRPEGLVVHERAMRTPGEALVEMAHLEAASVIAFERLALDLARLDAPTDLVRRARAAAADERRHTRAMEGLARARGATPRSLEVAPVAERSLEAIALENAVEGCVRETYGAVVATWQARTARDLDVRRAMQAIARDECAHADLSLDVHVWAMATLDEAARERVSRAEQLARRELRVEVEVDIATDLVVHLGLPSRTEARALLAGLSAHTRAGRGQRWVAPPHRTATSPSAKELHRDLDVVSRRPRVGAGLFRAFDEPLHGGRVGPGSLDGQPYAEIVSAFVEHHVDL